MGCPNGYLKCPEGVSDSEKAYCVPEEDLGGRCPITDMHILRRNQSNKADFSYADFNEYFKIGYSRSVEKDPLTEFQVAATYPCISPLS